MLLKKNILFMIIFFSVLLRAQEFDFTGMTLEELMKIKVSVASKKEELRYNAPGIISVVNRKEIDGFAAVNLGQILNKVTSAGFIHANVFTDNVVQFRGQSFTPYNNHVLILINGKPVRDPISGGLNNSVYASFPVDAIRQLEIIRGPGSVLYGSCAYAAVINIVTQNSEKEGLSFAGELTAGSYGTVGEAFSFNYKRDDLAGMLSVKYLTDDGPTYAFTGFDDDDDGYADETGKAKFDRETLGIFGNFTYRNWVFDFYYAKFLPYALSGSNVTWSDEPHQSLNQTHFFGNLGYSKDFLTHFSLKLDGNYNYHKMATELNMVNYAAEYFLEPNINYNRENLNIITGGTFTISDYYGDYLINNVMNSYSLYTQADFTVFRKYKLIAGLQYNKIDDISGNISPRLGLIAKFNDNIGGKLLYSSAFRKAYPLETSFKHPVFRGNMKITPELITTMEAQAYYNSRSVNTSLTVFRSKMADIIGRRWHEDPNTQPYGGYLMYYNQHTDVIVNGIELEAEGSLFANLFLTGSFTYQQNEDETGEAPAVLHPHLMAKIGLIHSIKEFQIGIFNNYFGQPEKVRELNPDVSVVNPEADDYDLLSLRLQYDFPEKIFDQLNVKLMLDVQNILDQTVWYPEYTSLETNTLIPLTVGQHFYFHAIVSF